MVWAAGGFNDGISSMALGDPNDPRSIAHFNQRIGDRVFFTVDSST
jgi:peptidoglycan-associated lipoprotein